ncbi:MULTISPECIES: hypothetical protein [Streptomyces]|uniref:hypothetical protein n=1 Tax=Streptomyces TaxID=1883 RepID=UPI0006486CA7|nr:hypothetical protein [Streptomyces sp. M10]QDD60220.1 hypothetical protein FE156_18305 [Streptomyces albidoflavus]WTC03592.1 hypothetical protein OG794_18040 [Streptomyces albidoflavus]
MNRRTMSLALAAAATLVLSACGADEPPSTAKDPIAGAEKGEGAQKESPSAEPSKAAGRPEIKLPDDVENVFEGWETGDKTKDAALTDLARNVDAMSDAVLRGDTESPKVAYYRQGDALVSSVKWVQAWLDEDLSYTGTIRHYQPNVVLSGDRGAGVGYCADESKAFNKSRKTGKVDRTPEEKPLVRYVVQMRKSDEGVWQVLDVQSKRGDAKCG